MKVTKYLAIVLVVVTVTTVVSAAGALATSKAAAQAQTQSDTPIAIKYQAGKTYSFKPSQYNYHFSDFSASVGTPTHYEFASAGTALSTIHAKAQAGGSTAGVGTFLQLTGINNPSDWDAIRDKPCRVTISMDYLVSAKGDENTFAQIWQATPGIQDNIAVHGTDKISVKTGTVTFDHTGIVNNFFSRCMSDGQIYGFARADLSAIQDPAGTGHATANVYVSSITVSFLDM